jgi:hypothetical protein
VFSADGSGGLSARVIASVLAASFRYQAFPGRKPVTRNAATKASKSAGVQIFDQDGNFLAEWKQFGRPSGVYIRDDIIYVADSQSDEKTNPPFRQGIRIGSVKDGKVTAFIPQMDPKLAMPEGLAADNNGNVFGGFATDMDFKKFAKN